MPRTIFIYCDESISRGRFYSNFYGGLLIEGRSIDRVERRLTNTIREAGLTGEVKWTAITPSVAGRYMLVVDALFGEMREGRVKIRIMFTQNRDVPSLTEAQRDSGYHRLYYQFIKWAFGLQFAGDPGEETRVHLRLDKMPASREQIAQFKGFVAALNTNRDFRESGVCFDKRRIVQIDSRRHALAQGLDLVLGSMAFRLNDRHKEKPDGARRRGKRTIQKELVYKHINRRIREIYPNFNIGVSTAQPNGPTDRWTHPYRHWCFVPKSSERDDGLTKRKAP